MTDRSRPGAALILAAGEGTRMRSAVPKVLHPIGGRGLLGHAVHAVAELDPEHLVVVLGHGGDQVREAVTALGDELARPVTVAVQEQQLGTGHAVRCGLDALPPGITGPVLVTYGDVPLLDADTLATLLAEHTTSGAAVTLLTTELADPTGYGRVLRETDGTVTRIVEQNDATAEQRAIREINSGVYAFDGAFLHEGLGRLSTSNNQGELYLTDVIAIAHDDGAEVRGVICPDEWQVARRQRPRPARPAAGGAEPQAARALDARGRHGGRPGHHVGRRRGAPRTRRRAAPRHAAARRHDGRRRCRRSARTPRSPTSWSGPARASCARTAASRRSARERPSDRSPTCAPARGSASAARSARSSRRRTPRSARARRCRTSPTSATRRSASTPTSAPAPCSSTTTASRKHRTVIGSHVRTGSDTMFIAPVSVGDGAYTGAGAVLTQDVPPGALAVLAGSRSAPSRAGWTKNRPGTPAAEAAKAATERLNRAVSSRTAMTKKSLMLFSGRAHPDLAEQVAKHLDVTITPQSAYAFANGEIFVRFEESVRGSDAFVLQCHSAPDQPLDHGAADHGRRAEARVGQADHRGRAVLPVTRARTRSTAAASRSRRG